MSLTLSSFLGKKIFTNLSVTFDNEKRREFIKTATEAQGEIIKSECWAETPIWFVSACE